MGARPFLRSLVAVALLSLLGLRAAVSEAETYESAENVDKVYVVDVSEIEPCTIFNGDQVSGFSVDLWETCARELNLKYRLQPVGGVQQKLDDLENGRADVAIGGVSWTEERESLVDFSVPELNAGLRAMVRQERNLLPSLSSNSRRIVMYLGAFLFVAGNVLWWAERGAGAIRREYFPGIFEAFWCVMATMTTVGYGDIAPKRWLGRCMAVLVMLSGIGLFGVLAAALTADLITERRVMSIDNVQSLKGLRVATKEGTSSSQFLAKHSIRRVGVESFTEACELLQAGKVDVVLFDEPAILYRVSTDPSLTPVGPQFKQEYYAFAFPQNSALRERVNRALLKAYNNGEYARIHDRWFGVK